MGLKEELAERLAGIDCKDKINEVVRENRDEIQEALYLNRKDKGVLDAVQAKVISRKLLVFGVATALLYWAGLDAETWGTILELYNVVPFNRLYPPSTEGSKLVSCKASPGCILYTSLFNISPPPQLAVYGDICEVSGI